MRRLYTLLTICTILVFTAGFGAFAQAPAAPQPKSELTEAEADKLDKKILIAQQAGKAASPDELGKAIAQLIAQQQQAAQQAATDLQSYYASLNKVEGHTLDPQTKKFVKNAPSK
jgi:hypothetical protein